MFYNDNITIKTKNSAEQLWNAGLRMFFETRPLPFPQNQEIGVFGIGRHQNSLVARIRKYVEFALSRRFGQAATSNWARPSPVILLRMWVPILASVFWLRRLRAFSLGPMIAFHRAIKVSPRLR
jgi:hypothetical protein